MPIIHRENISDNCVVGVWKITESVDELLSMIQFTEEDAAIFEKFKVKSRQAHWLSYRLMIRQLMGDQKCEFYYDEHGKLHFKDLNYFVSVTHSGIYSGVIISKNHNVGIDIEKLGDRINTLADKFLSEEEKSHLPEENPHRYLTVLWSAKEALYKLNGKPNIIFDRNIILSPFQLKNRGGFKGRIIREGKAEEYNLGYEFSENDEYILVFCADKSMKINTIKK